MKIIDRFLKYVRINTTSNSNSITTPSTKSQFILAKQLVNELYALNIDEIIFDEQHCYIYAILKGDKNLTKIGFISHLDTSENENGNNIQPNIIYNYNGENIKLNENTVLSTNVYPDLNNHKGKTLITTDGTTLLGSDDKAGIAEIMTMLEYFSKSNHRHGDIYICFTPDEEIGLGTKYFDHEIFSPDIAYTVDGSNLGEFSYENFNAATVKINIKGVSTHAGSAKGIMINAGKIATLLTSLIPDQAPENTEGYEGFYHLQEIKGNVSEASLKYIIRDFDKRNFEKRKKTFQIIVKELNQKYNNCIKLSINDTYLNMYDVIKNNKNLIKYTTKAITNTGVTPLIIPIRGGTDGTDISFKGIPCPNLGTGGHNFHSIYEYICVEDMDKVSKILISLVLEFSKEPKIVNKTKKLNY